LKAPPRPEPDPDELVVYDGGGGAEAEVGAGWMAGLTTLVDVLGAEEEAACVDRLGT
jgi:hypothetical protein